MLASLAGDAVAYRDLLNALMPGLRRYFQRRLHGDLSGHMEDLVQETLLAIHTRRMTYDPAQPFTAWAYAIARYKLIDLLRKFHRSPQLPLDDVADFLADPANTQGDAMDARDVDAMLDTLPERTRTLIRSVRVEGRSVKDTAERAGMSVAAVKVTIHRGIAALKKRFGDET